MAVLAIEEFALKINLLNVPLLICCCTNSGIRGILDLYTLNSNFIYIIVKKIIKSIQVLIVMCQLIEVRKPVLVKRNLNLPFHLIEGFPVIQDCDIRSFFF
jgi:hypothetical protein